MGAENWSAVGGDKVREPIGQTMEGLGHLSKDLGFYSELEGKFRAADCQEWHVLASVHMCLQQAPHPGFRRRGANRCMDVGPEFPKMEVGKRIKVDGKNVVQTAGVGSGTHVEGSTILMGF